MGKFNMYNFVVPTKYYGDSKLLYRSIILSVQCSDVQLWDCSDCFGPRLGELRQGS